MTNLLDDGGPALLPCPFCGSEDVSASYCTSMESALPKYHMVECGDCSALGPTETDPQRAALIWNRRMLKARNGGSHVD